MCVRQGLQLFNETHSLSDRLLARITTLLAEAREGEGGREGGREGGAGEGRPLRPFVSVSVHVPVPVTRITTLLAEARK